MLSLILAAAVFYLGVKSFTKTGIRLTANKTLHGAPAKACGVLCILLGLFLVWDGFLGMANIAALVSRSR